jgi:hypothetical protein
MHLVEGEHQGMLRYELAFEEHIESLWKTYTTFLLVESDTKDLGCAVELQNCSRVSTRSPVRSCQSSTRRCLYGFKAVQKRRKEPISDFLVRLVGFTYMQISKTLITRSSTTGGLKAPVYKFISKAICFIITKNLCSPLWSALSALSRCSLKKVSPFSRLMFQPYSMLASES